jgi:hypothetical protein
MARSSAHDSAPSARTSESRAVGCACESGSALCACDDRASAMALTVAAAMTQRCTDSGVHHFARSRATDSCDAAVAQR